MSETYRFHSNLIQHKYWSKKRIVWNVVVIKKAGVIFMESRRRKTIPNPNGKNFLIYISEISRIQWICPKSKRSLTLSLSLISRERSFRRCILLSFFLWYFHFYISIFLATFLKFSFFLFSCFLFVLFFCRLSVFTNKNNLNNS